MQVGLDGAVEVLHAAQFELLADLGRQLGDGLLDGRVARPSRNRGGFQGVDVGGPGGQRGVDDPVGQRLKLGVLGDEVGLGVQLDERAAPGRDQTFGRGPLGALADVLGALDAQRLNRLVEGSVAFGQRVLAVEHPGAGEFPKPLDVGSGEVRQWSTFL